MSCESDAVGGPTVPLIILYGHEDVVSRFHGRYSLDRSFFQRNKTDGVGTDRSSQSHQPRSDTVNSSREILESSAYPLSLGLSVFLSPEWRKRRFPTEATVGCDARSDVANQSRGFARDWFDARARSPEHLYPERDRPCEIIPELPRIPGPWDIFFYRSGRFTERGQGSVVDLAGFEKRFTRF